MQRRMLLRSILLAIITTVFIAGPAQALYTQLPPADADWLIIGAGPGGIITVSVLLEIGVDPTRITWLDPEFNVGRLGQYYANVPSNDRAWELIRFLNQCPVFAKCTCPALDYLKKLELNQNYPLTVIIEPLKCITNYLREQVISRQDSLSGLFFKDNLWHVETERQSTILAQHVVLATGSRPATLAYGQSKIIPLDYALDQENLASLITPDDRVGVVGGAHSAILILKYLSEMNVKKIYNFYKYPITYLVERSTTGLKGITAQWAREVLEKNPPDNLERIKIQHDSELEELLKTCTKVIYAIGYERNQLPPINATLPIEQYEKTTGVIAPRLFGIGIAFPEQAVNQQGILQYKVGLNSFIDYAHKMIPQWMQHTGDCDKTKYHRQPGCPDLNALANLANLFTIYAL
jgi:hypothetical protein